MRNTSDYPWLSVLDESDRTSRSFDDGRARANERVEAPDVEPLEPERRLFSRVAVVLLTLTLVLNAVFVLVVSLTP